MHGNITFTTASSLRLFAIGGANPARINGNINTNYGLTVTGPQQSEVIRRALRVSIDGANPFRVVQATWNLLEPSGADALAKSDVHPL